MNEKKNYNEFAHEFFSIYHFEKQNIINEYLLLLEERETKIFRRNLIIEKIKYRKRNVRIWNWSNY